MKKNLLLVILSSASLLLGITSCNITKENEISVCASESPHAEILNEAVAPLLKEKGYTLKVTILDWTIQNDAVKALDYDANYFQHRPYLENYDGNLSEYDSNYTYKNVFPTATVHFEPLRIYEGKSKASEFESKKKTATYEICSDSSNAIRALDLLKENGVIDNYEIDENGNPINLPSNITLIDESLLASSLKDYDYGVLPTNTALTAKISASELLPKESDSVADLRSNVVAANVNEYKNNEVYKTKIDVLTDALLDSSISSYIKTKYNGVVASYQKDLRK